MDRLLVLRLRSKGVAAEALLNGLPLARTPKNGGDCCVPVHEFVIAGANKLELVIGPPPLAPGAPAPAPVVGDGDARADAALLLPRVGQLASEHAARLLGQVSWASVDGEVYRPPLRLSQEFDIPVRFPRWRWLDAPPIAAADDLRGPVATFLQDVAIALSRGDPEHLIVAAKLRFEELALAYQRPAADDLARWRARCSCCTPRSRCAPSCPRPRACNCARWPTGACSSAWPPTACRCCAAPALMARRSTGRCGWPPSSGASIPCVRQQER